MKTIHIYVYFAIGLVFWSPSLIVQTSRKQPFKKQVETDRQFFDNICEPDPNTQNLNVGQKYII